MSNPLFGTNEPDWTTNPEEWGVWARDRLLTLGEQLHEARAELERSREQQEKLKEGLAAAEKWLTTRRQNSVVSLEPGAEVRIPAGNIRGQIEEVRINRHQQVFYVVVYWREGLYREVVLHEKDVESMEMLPAPPASVERTVQFE